MANDETERLMNEIGQLLSEETGHPLASVLLYAKLDINMVGPSILIERSNYVQYWRSAAESLTYPLLDLWEINEPGRRWAEMEYLLRNGKFTATFTYPEEIDQDEDEFDRRDRVVARHFGSKPIVYPPPRNDDGIQQFDL